MDEDKPSDVLFDKDNSVPLNWLACFHIPTGRSCYETHSLEQIIGIAVRSHSVLENLQYASANQSGSTA